MRSNGSGTFGVCLSDGKGQGQPGIVDVDFIFFNNIFDSLWNGDVLCRMCVCLWSLLHRMCGHITQRNVDVLIVFSVWRERLTLTWQVTNTWLNSSAMYLLFLMCVDDQRWWFMYYEYVGAKSKTIDEHSHFELFQFDLIGVENAIYRQSFVLCLQNYYLRRWRYKTTSCVLSYSPCAIIVAHFLEMICLRGWKWCALNEHDMSTHFKCGSFQNWTFPRALAFVSDVVLLRFALPE